MRFLCSFLLVVFATTLSSQLHAAPGIDSNDSALVIGSFCGAADVSPQEQLLVQNQVEDWIAQHGATSAVGGNIKIAWHVIYDGAEGNIPQSVIDATIVVLNEAYAGLSGGVSTEYTFSLASVSRTNKRQWFNMEAGSSQEQQAKNALAIDVPHRLNIYSCKPPSGSNWAVFPWPTPKATRSTVSCFITVTSRMATSPH
jgi:hypothetical protein